jgi:hypothetical protein
VNDHVIASFGTGLLRTTITATRDGDYRWHRRDGPKASPTRLPGAETLSLIAGLDHGVLRCDTPRASAGAYTHTATGFRSAAMSLLQPSDPPVELLDRAAADLGPVLRRLHGLRFGTPLPAEPPGVRRLRRWLEGKSPDANAARLYELMLDRCGHARLTVLHDWLEEVSTPTGPTHGALGLGSLILPDKGEQVVLFTGADLASGTPALDLGWLVGELAELATFAGSDIAPLCGRLAHTVLDGYGIGSPAACDAISRAAVLRIALHLHDYAAYVGWHPQVAEYVPVLNSFMETGGQAVWRRLSPTPERSTAQRRGTDR